MTLAVYFLRSNNHYLTFIENFLKEKLEGWVLRYTNCPYFTKMYFTCVKSTESSEIYPKIIKYF